MNPNQKKMLTFSYLDIFLVLLLILFLSVGIYYATEQKLKEEQTIFYAVEMETVLPHEFSESLPQKGDRLLDESGNEKGKVLSVETDSRKEGILVRLRCRLEQSSLTAGETFLAENKKYAYHMSVTSLEELLPDEEAQGETPLSLEGVVE